MLRALGMKNKMKLGRRSRPMLVALARAKRLRGTIADPFRWAKVRRIERALIPEYARAIKDVAARLTAEKLDDAVTIAALPDQVRGYEHLKLSRAARYRTELAASLKTFLQLN
jgi:indolepyruvate ferredoxin oxidoreductase